MKFGPGFRRRLKRREGQLGDTWHVDEVFITIRGLVHYLLRAVDQDGDVIYILVQRRRNARAAKCFFAEALKVQDAAGLLISTSHLLGDGAEVRGDVKKFLAQSKDKFTEHQIGSALELIGAAAGRPGQCHPNAEEFFFQDTERHEDLSARPQFLGSSLTGAQTAAEPDPVP